MFPKPRRPPKAMRKPLRAKQWGVRRRPPRKQPPAAFPKPTRPEKTKHARRHREWGYMAFARARGCELARDVELQRVLEIRHVCSTRVIEFAHLSDLRRYDPRGDIGSGLDRDVHRGIDGKEGGKAPWYAARERDVQRMIRDRLSARPRMAWDALSPEERAAWEERARAERPRRRRPVLPSGA